MRFSAVQSYPRRPVGRPLRGSTLSIRLGGIAFSTVSRIKRTLDGAEIDKIISDVQALKALAIEHHRRADWRKRELSANSFQT
jgi:hypothetical protein